MVFDFTRVTHVFLSQILYYIILLPHNDTMALFVLKVKCKEDLKSAYTQRFSQINWNSGNWKLRKKISVRVTNIVCLIILSNFQNA